MTLADIICAAAHAGTLGSATLTASDDADLDERVAQLVATGATLESDRAHRTADGTPSRIAILWSPGVTVYVATDRTAMQPGALVTERAA